MNPGATTQERIKLRIVVPLILAIGILLTTFGLGIHVEQRRANERSIRRTGQAVRRLLEAEQKERSETMLMTIQELLNDDRLAEAFQKQDRAALLERTKPLFENLRRIYKISHFHFESPERVNVLRVHNPDRSGDTINDEALLEVEGTGKPVAGLEQGSLGQLVLRVALPWRRDGRLLGYVELGVEFEDMIKSIHDELDVDLFVALDKTALQRGDWERARQASGRPANWDQFPFAVVTDRTLDTIPQTVQRYLQRDRKQATRRDEVVYWKGGVTQIVFLPLKDLAAKTPGELIVLRDISAAVAETRESVWAMGLICVCVSAGLVVFFYSFLGRIERKLAERTAKLEAEIAERQAAQRALREANEGLEERVEQRTRDFKTANAELHNEMERREKAQAELLEAQRQLLEASHQAGMAEVATSVLHNVGNVLNSANVSNSVITSQVRESKVENLGKVVALLREHEADLAAFLTQDPRGKQLPRYLEMLADYLAEEQGQLLQELKSLGSNIEHIKEIVAMQQNYAKVSGVLEPLLLTDLAEDALRFNAVALERQQIQVVRDTPKCRRCCSTSTRCCRSW